MERRDFFIDDIEKLAAVVAHLLGYKGLKKTNDQQLEINSGLAEFFDLDLEAMPMEVLETKIKAIENPQRLDYLLQLLELEIENENLLGEQLKLRNKLIKMTRESMDLKYEQQKITTFFRQINSPQ